jgi:glucan 1,3-beta-glucosidase
LSADSIARLNAGNENNVVREAAVRKKKKKQYKNVYTIENGAQVRRKRTVKRNVSGAMLEEGRYHDKYAYVKRRGGAGTVREFIRKRGERRKGGSSGRCCWITFGIIVLLIIFIPVGVTLSKKSSSSNSSSSSGDVGQSNLPDRSTIPATAKGTVLDPYTWYTTTDFNTTYTGDTVGGLSVMGLMSNWDDSAQANQNTPPLNSNWTYGQIPIRGVNLGGWLSLEPFITPSLFNTYTAQDSVIDEYTLCTTLGPSAAAQVLEKHYATFVTESTFSDIANAGMDHVRIPYPYWAVTTYDGDPYVPNIAWRYLLRGIEYARKYGLRVNLDLHSLPGSQNGWNHSGRQGTIGWLNGTDGTLNGQRSLDIHHQLSQFFAQPRYNNVITFYGLVNEPRMTIMPIQPIIDWNTQAVQLIRKNGMQQHISFGDGFLQLDQWNSMFKSVDPGLTMDTHQYQIFNTPQLNMKHTDKVNMACQGWSTLMSTANNPSTG